MKADLVVDTIDTHTAGEPTRVVTGGIASVLGGTGTVRQQRDRFSREYDGIRRYLMKEPRGHDSMFGAVPVVADDPRADLGVFFMDNTGYLDMCGHGTIGTVTALIETGQLPAREDVAVETPAGLVTARPRLADGAVADVTIRNVPSAIGRGGEVTVDHRGSRLTVPVTVAYAGNAFALVDVEAVDLPFERSAVTEFVELGLAIRDRVNAAFDPSDPVTGRPVSVELTEFYQRRPDVDRNVTVFGNGMVDRSPCGTGTCAKMALLHSRGALAVDEEYRHRSLIGTEFTGRIVEVETRGDRTVITPEITGSAYVTGKHTFLRDPADPIDGFRLRGDG